MFAFVALLAATAANHAQHAPELQQAGQYVLTNLGEYNETIRSCQQALRVDPEFDEARVNLALGGRRG